VNHKTGADAARMVARYAETKTHLETALHHLHAAMAITPWFDLVESLGRTSNGIASELAKHAHAFEDALAPCTEACAPGPEPDRKADEA
jgi:hypothetical protein